MDHRALDKVHAELSANRQNLRWLTARYPNQFRIALQALHWIEFDENTDRTDAARVLNDEVAADAVAVVGTPYLWRGASPSIGFDASGLVMWLWARQGVSLPHNSVAQLYSANAVGQIVDQGPKVHVDRLAIGDLLFFYGGSHVSVYIGRGYVVDAPHTGTFVQILRINQASRLRDAYFGAARISA